VDELTFVTLFHVVVDYRQVYTNRSGNAVGECRLSELIPEKCLFPLIVKMDDVCVKIKLN
jgi:hypothetical protein